MIFEPSSDAVSGHHWRSMHVWLYAILAALSALDAAKGAVAVLSSCDCHAVAVGVMMMGSCRRDSELMAQLSKLSLVLGMCGLLPDFAVKLWWIVRTQQHRTVGRWLSWLLPAGTSAPPEADHWVAAATRSFYLETTEAVHSFQSFATLLLLPTLLLSVFSRLVFSTTTLRTLLASEADPDVLPVLCIADKGRIGCQLVVWRRLLLQVAWTPAFNLVIVFLTTPRLMWNRIMEEAAAAYGRTGLQRQIVLPWLCLPLVALNSVLGLSYYFFLWSDKSDISEGLVVAWASFCLASGIYGLFLMAWSHILLHTARYIRLKLRYLLCRPAWVFRHRLSSRTHRVVMSSLSFKGKVSREEDAQQLAPDLIKKAMPLAESSPCLIQAFHSGNRKHRQIMNDEWDSSSAHHKRLALIYTAYFLLCCTDVIGTSWADTTILCFMRLVMAGLFFMVKDRRATLMHLERHGAALGLVMDAKSLLKALKAVEADKQLPPDIPLFRATILRMRQTLAVSYRWQPVPVAITSETMSLNMNLFQMQKLAEEIPKSGCKFVWIDRVSVCQEKGELQSKLLARMMAVFSSAQTTLAIQSTPHDDEDRYHRRAWTAQEYCCARKLVVVTQSSYLDRSSVKQKFRRRVSGCLQDATSTLDEIEYFTRLRSQVQDALTRCRPFWLMGEKELQEMLTEERSSAIIRQYWELAGRVRCKYREDKLRALCPMLAAIPVDGHDELVSLCQRINEAAPAGMNMDKRGMFLLHRCPTTRSRPTNSISKSNSADSTRSSIGSDDDEPASRFKLAAPEVNSENRNPRAHLDSKWYTNESQAPLGNSAADCGAFSLPGEVGNNEIVNAGGTPCFAPEIDATDSLSKVCA